ncbi:MAG: serine hydrolase, partial [Candidatus Nitrotoga sp.]
MVTDINMKLSLLFFIALLSPLLARAQLANLPPAPVLAAKSYLLYDFTSNQILVDQNGNERTEPASITKLMTAYLTFSSLRLNKFSLDQTITPSAEALRAQGVE